MGSLIVIDFGRVFAVPFSFLHRNKQKLLIHPYVQLSERLGDKNIFICNALIFSKMMDKVIKHIFRILV